MYDKIHYNKKNKNKKYGINIDDYFPFSALRMVLVP